MNASLMKHCQQIIIGSVACQRFSSEIAEAAVTELDKTLLLYEKAAQDHPTPKRGLVRYFLCETEGRTTQVH